ncbi:MAG: hypothetical protein B6I20_14580, partial [Bacteroidetes bacterium 4572_117]
MARMPEIKNANGVHPFAKKIARAVYPASEHKTAQWMQGSSSVLELHNLEATKINRHHLYQASKMFHGQKDGIE